MRLIHDGRQPGAALAEPLEFGMQDTRGAVLAGTPRPAGLLQFDAVLGAKAGAAGMPVFAGGFVHGPPAARFLYLSWKRVLPAEHPWGWRIKVPLAGIGWPEVAAAEEGGLCIAADVAGRRPHASEPVHWQMEPLGEAPQRITG